MNFMTIEQARKALEKAGKFHRGEVKLPPEIIELRKLIKAKIKNAELFFAKLRVVDESMVKEIVALKLQLDNLYADFSLN